MPRETARDHLCSRYAAVIAARARTTSRLTPKPSYKFTISFTVASGATLRQFLKYELENVGLSQLSVNSDGDIPVESLSLNFTKITGTFTPLEPGSSGQPQTVGYD